MQHKELDVLLGAGDTDVALDDPWWEDGVLRINLHNESGEPLIVELCHVSNEAEVSYHRVAFVDADAAVACKPSR